MKGSIKLISRVFIFGVFIPQRQTFVCFFKNKFLQDDFFRISKKGINNIGVYIKNRGTKFQVSLFFAVQWPKDQVKVMTSLFETPLLAFLIVVCQNKCYFLVTWDKIANIGMFLKEIFDFRNLDVFDLNLAWPWVRYENECLHQILRLEWLLKPVSYDTRAIFSWVTSFDLTSTLACA